MDRSLRKYSQPGVLASAVVLALGCAGTSATEPCGDFGACKVLVETNSSDGDVGFHFLGDGAEVYLTKLIDPRGKQIFRARANHALKEQTFTEMFVESSEPLCFDPTLDDDPDNDDEDFQTLEEFLELWAPGTYRFFGRTGDREKVIGETELGFDLPAAPQDLSYAAGMITWEPGDDLGECADSERLQGLVNQGKLPIHPEHVEVVAWEIVLVPDVDDGDPIGDEQYSIRISGSVPVLAVSVPLEYLAALPDDTPAKMEVGAIGAGDNATFTEYDGICLNEVDGCGEDEDED